jgi:hypothetical protein
MWQPEFEVNPHDPYVLPRDCGVHIPMSRDLWAVIKVDGLAKYMLFTHNNNIQYHAMMMYDVYYHNVYDLI